MTFLTIMMAAVLSGFPLRFRGAFLDIWDSVALYQGGPIAINVQNVRNYY